MKTDNYRSARGGWSRILRIHCTSCGTHLFHYQKDGPGPLKRLYHDRMIGNSSHHLNGQCSRCKEYFGKVDIYLKENRLCVRLFAQSISYKIVKQGNI